MRWDDSPDRSFTANLREMFLGDPRGLPPFLYGVGTWFGPEVKAPTALFIVDEEEVAVEDKFVVGSAGLGQRYPNVGGSRLRRTYPRLMPRYLRPGEDGGLVVGRIADASDRVRERLGNFLGSALVITSGPPEALAKVGSVLFDPVTRGRGTVGAPVIRTDDDGRIVEGFLTAGHAVAGRGAQILQSRRMWPSRRAPLGRVFLHRDPVVPYGMPAPPGFDIAVVDLASGQRPFRAVSSGVAQLPSSPPQPVPVRVRGGFTPDGPGMICASLMAGGHPSRQWKDCWVMVPARSAKDGDSGACVVTTPGRELVGMLVGGAQQGGSSRYGFHYVQDHDSVQRSLLTQAGVRLS